MSVFVVSTNHISAMLDALDHPYAPERYSYNGQEHDFDRTRVGQLLLNTNYESYNVKYDQHCGAMFRYTRQGVRSPLERLKLLDCYEYQACEAPGYEGSEAEAIVRVIRRCVIWELPGYDEAPWAI